jgi:crotonobetainyl-CoA:carnitine CoA-transferase CaiB-like acyl-CoA transferase
VNDVNVRGAPEQRASEEGGSVNGPLRGLSVLEIAGAGPVPFCGKVLADLKRPEGAEVVHRG